MIPKECKRLAEVDFPIAVVSKHSAREKSIRHGHPSTLHLWWARRPLAACRSMLMALLLPDPCDEHCPDEFKERARNLLPELTGEVGPEDIDLRRALLKFIGDFANWDHSNHPTYLAVSRGLVNAAHPEETPLVVDPFAGGGSIPLEALRIGCDTFASDLNPVACLILKVMLEDIPRHGPKLVEELRLVGAEIKKQAEKELAEFYPKDPDGAIPVAYIWARTIRCESPNCGAEIPLIRSYWLSKKENQKQALRYKIVRQRGVAPRVDFEIFEPRTDGEVPNRTVTRAKATCLACGVVVPQSRVRTQLALHQGGADAIFDEKGKRIGGAILLAVVVLHEAEARRKYRLPTAGDYRGIRDAINWTTSKRKRLWHGALEDFPNEATPWPGGHRSVVSLRAYGMEQWSDLFTARQKASVAILGRIITNLTERTPAVREIAGLALSRFTDICNACCGWESTKTQVRHLFTRHDLPVVWDFAEPSALAEQAGDYSTTLNTMIRVIERAQVLNVPGQVNRADARISPLPTHSASVWFTDPPYYDSVAYADLSDFFYVWLKRVLPGHALLITDSTSQDGLTPKIGELTVTTRDTLDSPPKTQADFERGMGTVFTDGRRVLKDDGVGSVVFAHKTTEGWESLLTGMIKGGWTITGSWPLSTELGNRLNARDTASLAGSVHLICRPRSEDAGIGDWQTVLRELPTRVGDWIERLQSEGIRGADLVFACIGPALEIFSRYSEVETADGREVKLAEYLEKVWEVVGRMALEQVLGTDEAKARNGAAGALEEDARLTALFLWTLQSTTGKNGDSAESAQESNHEDDDDEATPKSQPKGLSLIFDVVRRFAQPLGIELPKWEDRIIKTEKGVVRLLPVSERAKQLFGDDGARAVADWIVNDPVKNLQQVLFPEEQFAQAPKIRGRAGRSSAARQGKIELDPATLDADRKHEATTLDRVHAAMLLQAGGQTNALRALLKAEQDRGPDFLRLANALSALYPKGSEEKRLLDAMLLAVPR